MSNSISGRNRLGAGPVGMDRPEFTRASFEGIICSGPKRNSMPHPSLPKQGFVGIYQCLNSAEKSSRVRSCRAKAPILEVHLTKETSTSWRRSTTSRTVDEESDKRKEL